jgi:jouberin
MLPVWEEVLIYNDSYQHFVDPSTKVIMFFEVLDTVSMNRAARQNNRRQQPQQDSTGGYYRIAWAFLKVCYHVVLATLL